MAKTPSKKSAKAPKKAAGGKKKKTRTESYSTYNYRVLKQVTPTRHLQEGHVDQNSFINDIFERIALEASKLCRFSKKATLRPRDPDRGPPLLPISSKHASPGHQGCHQVLLVLSGPIRERIRPCRDAERERPHPTGVFEHHPKERRTPPVDAPPARLDFPRTRDARARRARGPASYRPVRYLIWGIMVRAIAGGSLSERGWRAERPSIRPLDRRRAR